ncbi:MAG: hypothetical protein DVS81_11280 [Candidatus Accumulibacter meliphilus]|jgi:hypothetical protein|uniref:Uncharacterized protein n=1 Tax=Candidatus Accumulibacter meliphilus TaxID=2211374 RepID=A0A369XPN8_9PROT|nr:MAG: hypothetical protein DVS81_11280 [Candidatus Accumulibacter meliphilus]
MICPFLAICSCHGEAADGDGNLPTRFFGRQRSGLPARVAADQRAAVGRIAVWGHLQTGGVFLNIAILEGRYS